MAKNQLLVDLLEVEGVIALRHFARMLLDAADAGEFDPDTESADAWIERIREALTAERDALRMHGGTLHTIEQSGEFGQRVAAAQGLLSLRIETLETYIDDNTVLRALQSLKNRHVDDACDSLLHFAERLGHRFPQRRGVSQEIMLPLWLALTKRQLPVEAVNERELPEVSISG